MKDDTRTVRLPGNWPEIITRALEYAPVEQRRDIALLRKCLHQREDTPRPMATAPRDGTVVLVFVEGTDFPHPMCYAKSVRSRPYFAQPKGEAWRMAWDDFAMRDEDLLGWLPAPTYSGEIVR